jgi:hypothetical protein
MINIFNSELIKDREFQKFLGKEKFSFVNFFFIYIGALVTCFLLGTYLDVLNFSPLISFGNLLLFWAAWLVINFPLAYRPGFERLVLWTNNLLMAGVFFYLVFLSPADWILILLPYLVFALLLINFIQANFFPVSDSLAPTLVGFTGLIYFYICHLVIFQIDPSALLIFLFMIILSVAGAAFLIWNSIRTQKFLYKTYLQRRELEETAVVLEIRIRAKTRELQEQAELLRQENRLKTDALRRRIEELERFRRMVVGRELKMVQLKDELVQKETELAKLRKDGHGK